MTRKEHPKATPATILAEEYIKKHPKVQNRTLARMMHEIHPDIIKSVDKGRSIIRRLKGAAGDASRNHVHVIPFYITEEEVENHEDWTEPFIIHDKKLGVMADLQGIFCDIESVDLVIKKFKESDVKAILINGDLIDNYGISRYGQSVKYKTFREELQFTEAFLERLSKDFKVYYKFGNHEKRFDDYVMQNMARFEGMITLQGELKLAEKGIDYIHHLRQVNFGDLVILHGHEKPSKFTPAKIGESIIKWWQLYSGKLKVKIMVAHHHRRDIGILKNIDGTFSEGYALGGLCKRMNYGPYMPMDQGAAICTNVDGVTLVDNFEV